MSYDALMVFRPALESILFGYRISKDLALAEVWINKNVNQKEFREKFRFADYPLDMPFRDDIKDRIDMLNDSWEHPNVNYAAKSLVIDQKEIRVHFYDHDDQFYYLALFSFLENCLRILTVIRESMKTKFSDYLLSTELQFCSLRTQLNNIKLSYKNKVI